MNNNTTFNGPINNSNVIGNIVGRNSVTQTSDNSVSQPKVQAMKADIGIITTREDEFEAVLHCFLFRPHAGSHGRTYGISYVQTVVGDTCIVAVVRCSEQGNDVAQQVARDMIEDLDPQLLLVVGIAGGVPSREFTLGDVMISNRIHNFNVNAHKDDEITSFDVRGGIHPRVSDITAALHLYKQGLFANWNQDFTGSRPSSLNPLQIKFDGDSPISWRKEITDSITYHFGNPQFRKPLFITGSIASSNSLIRKPAILIQWIQNARTIRVVEMETAGVYQAAQQIDHQYPVMAIRGISDIVGLERDPTWSSYACYTAAAFTSAFIKAGIIKPRGGSATTATWSPQFDNVGKQEPEYPRFRQAWGQSKAVEIFISYAHEDELLQRELVKHLSLLQRQGLIKCWYNRQIEPGANWAKEIDARLESSQIILLLISADFIASPYCYSIEMRRALERQGIGKVRVIPIILRPVDWYAAPFGNLQPLPYKGKPIITWENLDDAFLNVANGIRRVVESM